MSDVYYVVIAQWEPSGEIAAWRGGMWDSQDQALDEWRWFEREVGGAKFVRLDCYVLEGEHYKLRT